MNITTDSPRKIGKVGEDAAADFLESQGHVILARNWRSGRNGELDLVTKDGNTTVFVEVKTRRRGSHFLPVEAVTEDKLAKMRRVGLSWAYREGWQGDYRFDIIGVLLDQSNTPAFDWLKDVGQ
ncbi:YraN family protein [Actinomyces minihominis]|uniref:YraN family protein n=1 Tax=Actinomyces minihominis TaxID=2002838 RepID=UPI001A929D13|nr:YraN family protein [Actinomyces minihominis]